MDGSKILKVTGIYRELFEAKGVQPKRRRDFIKRGSSREATLAHCYYMINEIDKFVEEERTGKAFRWLGFVQGVLWREEQYTIKELKDHNRPDEEQT